MRDVSHAAQGLHGRLAEAIAPLLGLHSPPQGRSRRPLHSDLVEDCRIEQPHFQAIGAIQEGMPREFNEQFSALWKEVRSFLQEKS